jgi:hypothetical protein
MDEMFMIIQGLEQYKNIKSQNLESGFNSENFNVQETISLDEIRLNLTFHSENTQCDPANFNALKIFSDSCLNWELLWHYHRWQKTHEKYSEIRLKAFHFQC